MDVVLDGLRRALSLLVHLDREMLGITALSLQISAAATLVSPGLGISAGVAVALSRFPAKRLVVSLVNTGMGLPPVVVGLFVSILLWRSGPLGALGLLYTPTAIVIAQALIATPIVMGITVSAVQSLPPALHLQILALHPPRERRARAARAGPDNVRAQRLPGPNHGHRLHRSVPEAAARLRFPPRRARHRGFLRAPATQAGPGHPRGVQGNGGPRHSPRAGAAAPAAPPLVLERTTAARR